MASPCRTFGLYPCLLFLFIPIPLLGRVWIMGHDHPFAYSVLGGWSVSHTASAPKGGGAIPEYSALRVLQSHPLSSPSDISRGGIRQEPSHGVLNSLSKVPLIIISRTIGWCLSSMVTFCEPAGPIVSTERFELC
jgi:hypothetical protein